MALPSKQWIGTEDLNRVFWVLYGLYKFDPQLIDGAWLAYAIKRLTKSELKAGGPYGSAKNSVETITNGLIAAFLVQYEVSLPNVEKYITKVLDSVNRKKMNTSMLCFMYVVAPILNKKNKQRILAELNKLKPKNLENSAHSAVYISTVLKIEPKSNINPYVEHLLLQIDNKDSDKGTFNFSEKNTTSKMIVRNGLIVEALSYYILAHTKKTKKTQSSILYKDVCRRTKSELASLPSPLDKTSLNMWRQMIIADKNHEIVLMPKFFAETLIGCPDYLMAQCNNLGTANFYNWISTVIYDDFIDEEGSPGLLPLANITHRSSLQIYNEVLADTPYFNAYVEKLYRKVDTANAWEVANTRAEVNKGKISITNLPVYEERELLADRALGHVIGPILITMRLPKIQPEQIKAIEQAMKHYLIARQLNDDLHDWRKDLQAGHLSSVLTDMLDGIEVRTGVHDLEELIPKLEDYFLKRGLKIACQKLLEHISSSRRALNASMIVKNKGGFILLLDNLQISAEDALLVALNRQDFVKAYNNV